MKLFKNKYRLIQEGNIFYAQIRICFIWCYMHNYTNTSFWDAEKYKFSTLDDAIEFISSEIQKSQNSPKN